MDWGSVEYGRGQYGLADAMQHFARRLLARGHSAVELAALEYGVEPPTVRYYLLDLYVWLSMGVSLCLRRWASFADNLSLSEPLVQEMHPGSFFPISNSSSAFQALTQPLLY
jgi:hypothetical protein